MPRQGFNNCAIEHQVSIISIICYNKQSCIKIVCNIFAEVTGLLSYLHPNLGKVLGLDTVNTKNSYSSNASEFLIFHMYIILIFPQKYTYISYLPISFFLKQVLQALHYQSKSSSPCENKRYEYTHKPLMPQATLWFHVLWVLYVRVHKGVREIYY